MGERVQAVGAEVLVSEVIASNSSKFTSYGLLASLAGEGRSRGDESFNLALVQILGRKEAHATEQPETS